MSVTRARMNELDTFARARNGLPYAYGGSFSRNVRDSTDCSGAIFSAAAILDGKNPYQRYGSTETARLARMNGTAAPCGIRPASSAAAVPADAPLKIGFQHGGGGEYSHTACTVNFGGGRELSFESRGWPGVLYGPGSTATNPGGTTPRAWNSGLFHDFWFYPGPIIDGPIDPNAFPLPAGYFYGPYDGPDESISGRAGEPAEWTDGLRRWQAKAGVPVDGIYGEATRKRAIDYQLPAGLLPDGKIGPLTWALAFKEPRVNEIDQLYTRVTEFITGFVGPIGSDVKDIRQQLTGGRDKDQYGGHPQGGNRTLYDLAAATAEKEGVPGAFDTLNKKGL